MGTPSTDTWRGNRWLIDRALPMALAAAALGLAMAWVRATTGVFVIGIQGMVVGAVLGTVSGRLARRDRFNFPLMLAGAVLLTGVYSAAHFVGGDLLRPGPFEPGSWAAAMAGGDVPEAAIGYSRPGYRTHVFRDGGGFVLFALVDAFLQWMLTVVMHRVALPSGGHCARCGGPVGREDACAECGQPVDEAKAAPPAPVDLPRPRAALTAAWLVPIVAWGAYGGAIVLTAQQREDADREARRQEWMNPRFEKESPAPGDSARTLAWKDAHNAMVDAWNRYQAAPVEEKDAARAAWLQANVRAIDAQQAQLEELQAGH